MVIKKSIAKVQPVTLYWYSDEIHDYMAAPVSSELPFKASDPAVLIILCSGRSGLDEFYQSHLRY